MLYNGLINHTVKSNESYAVQDVHSELSIAYKHTCFLLENNGVWPFNIVYVKYYFHLWFSHCNVTKTQVEIYENYYVKNTLEKYRLISLTCSQKCVTFVLLLWFVSLKSMNKRHIEQTLQDTDYLWVKVQIERGLTVELDRNPNRMVIFETKAKYGCLII